MEEEIISEHKVLQSAAGYYVGTLYFDKEHKVWLPYDRASGYFETEAEAELQLFHYKNI